MACHRNKFPMFPPIIINIDLASKTLLLIYLTKNQDFQIQFGGTRIYGFSRLEPGGYANSATTQTSLIWKTSLFRLFTNRRVFIVNLFIDFQLLLKLSV